MAGSSAPLLNDYKKDFFWKRLPQTVLGGPKLKLGFGAPAYVYLNQVLLFLLPWILGGIFTVLVEVVSLTDYVAVCIYGGIMVLMVLLTQAISLVVQKKEDVSVAPLQQTINVLAEEDEVDFTSCCGVETFKFIVPVKKIKVNILFHALLSGALCGLGMWYLLPQTLNGLYNSSAGATVILFILGWLTVCIAQYSLTVGAPPEPAAFRTLDTWEIAPLTRPFYALVFMGFDLTARYIPVMVPVNYYLHIVFVFLPVMWTLGLLPPLDALFLWMFEQVLVGLMGGSPMASDLRLILMLTLSLGVFLAAYFIPNDLVTVILLCVMGYLLSTDLGGLGSQFLKLCTTQHNNKSKSDARQDSEKTIMKPKSNFFVTWAFKEGHFIMLFIAGGLGGVINYFSPQISADIPQILGYIIMGLLVIQKLLSDMQRVYVFFGIWRNALYPSSIQRTLIFQKRKKRLLVLGIIRRILLEWVSPLVMLAYLAMVITTFPSTSPLLVWTVFGATRAFRWIWQSPSQSLLEISVIHIINYVIPSGTLSWTSSVDIATQLLISGLCRDRLFQVLSKLYFFMVTLVTSWTDKKQRHVSTVPTIVLSVLFFPVVLAIIAISAALSAPLLPIFTLPIFLVGFPRPNKAWPASVGASANKNADTVYYEQLSHQLAAPLRTAFANGSLDEPSPGDHYLIRYQDRFVWVFILERGCRYCTISVKGLELQETSCHTVEAARLDDIFETTFEHENGVSCCSLNRYPFNAMTPYDACVVKVYSDAKNVLTGIIDSSDSLQIMTQSFIKALVWVMLHHNAKSKSKLEKPEPPNMAGSRRSLRSRLSTARSNRVAPGPSAGAVVPGTGLNDQEHGAITTKTAPEPKLTSSWDSITSEVSFHQKPNKRPISAKSRQSSVSIPGSNWSDDNESLELENFDSKKNKKINLIAGLETRQNQGSKNDSAYNSSVDPMSKSKQQNHVYGQPAGILDNLTDEEEELFKELDFGLPAVDIHQPKKTVPSYQSNLKGTPYNNLQHGHGIKPVTNLAGSMQFSSPYSSRLSLPLKWREIPIENTKIDSLLSDFPKDWFKWVLTLLDLEMDGKNSESVAAELAEDEVLMGIYAQLVMACYAVTEILGLGGSDVISMGASHVYKVYHGDIPWSPSSEWVTEDKELYQLVIKAYRLAFKLMLDQVLLGEASSNEELQEYFEEYERDLFIGSEKDPEWQEAVLCEKPMLFSLGHDSEQNTYNSRVLTLQDVTLQIGKLNAEAVKGQWANLGLELLYFTNDDEERYSIQAHPTLLRNLTVQSADPPLGYPVFSSEPMSVPSL
ncbi:pecanex-like protein 4 [Lingula anatina]|uniref:Pecanex-like protein n=1 Tax=Lingula anatina TaxID=7574 RepID=A0A1S3H9R6_LINAN|nr:pecanex-like protein 4 [Lingula anatina]|eukprot:XP_013381869.1 pecanex-like protein 4 [Lingula anatina]